VLNGKTCKPEAERCQIEVSENDVVSAYPIETSDKIKPLKDKNTCLL
jgi:hypothetical protein